MPLASDEIDGIIETIETATEENKISSMRKGQVVHLPPDGELWVAGDVHDHRRNFEKFVGAADLGRNPQRHIVFQELIHGDHFDSNMAEDSWRMLIQAAGLKCDYSSQVHFLFANHDLAQIHGEGIMKSGLSVCEAFNRGVKRDFGDRRATAHVAITEFLLSLPLAIRTHNGLFLSHSIPTDEQVDKFDYTVFDRDLTGEDYRRRTGPVYQLVWGRRMTPATAGFFADRVGARLLITGHQPQESGYATNGDHQIIIASDHNQGVFLATSLSEEYDINGLAACATKFVALEMPTASAENDGAMGRGGDGETAEAETEAETRGHGDAEKEPTIASDFDSRRREPEDLPEEPSVPQGRESSRIPVTAAPRLSVSQSSPAKAAVSASAAPNEVQRDALCVLLADVLIDIRQLVRDGHAAQAADLAEVFERLPKEMIGQGAWSRSGIVARLRAYEQSHTDNPGRSYSAQFERIVYS